MNNDWKPTEQNIGQPVLDTYIPSIGTSHIYSKWYDVDTTKINSIKDVEAVFSAIGLKVSETNENFDEVKHLLIIPEEPKTLDDIQQEFDEKIDELIEKTKRNFYAHKLTAERKYEYKFDWIFDDFEYAKQNGNFPPKLKLTYNDNGLSAGSFEPHFVIKQGNKHEGYYTFGNGRYFKYYMLTKPNMIARFFMKTCLALRWVDETN